MKKKLFSRIPQVFFAVFVLVGIFLYAQLCLLPTEQIVARSVFAETNNLLHPDYPIHKKEKIIAHGSRTKRQVALTFDGDMTDGMKQTLQAGKVTTYADRRIIDHLIKNNVKATFFLTGMWIETYPQETKMMAENPLFELANHSYSHPSFAGECFGLRHISPNNFTYEIERTQELLKEVTGKENKYFRFPGGCYDDASLDFIAKEGLQTVHWDSVAHDGFNEDTQQIVSNVVNSVQNGSIIVMHIGGETNTPKTFEALQQITSILIQQGFSFVKVSEVLDADEQDIAQEVITSRKVSVQHINSPHLLHD